VKRAGVGYRAGEEADMTNEREPERPQERGTALHPEKTPKPEKLDADLDDVIDLFEHNRTESDEPDIQSDAPAPG
jgi:hypothetical protein